MKSLLLILLLITLPLQAAEPTTGQLQQLQIDLQIKQQQLGQNPTKPATGD